MIRRKVRFELEHPIEGEVGVSVAETEEGRVDRKMVEATGLEFPCVRVASIECGSEWAEGLVRKLKKAYGQMPSKFERDPVEQLRHHVFVAPYYEDDIAQLRDLIGASQILFGSDFPHAEGLAEPTRFVEDIEGFPEKEVRQIMCENGRTLIASH